MSRNLFELDNARYLSPDEVVQTFVPTESFWRLFSAKNHIVLGARGSGKTAMFRMAAHSHLAKSRDKDAQKIVSDRSFIGFYMPTKADWVGGLKNKSWLSDAQKEDVFCWRLNLSSCLSLISSIESCIDAYSKDDDEKVYNEIKISKLLSQLLLDDETSNTLKGLSEQLEKLDFRKQTSIARQRVTGNQADQTIGLVFHNELFQPLHQAIRAVCPILEIPDKAIWMLCIDEAEALERFHHRILNSYLRTHSDNLVFKISTTPYGHHTLETNVGEGLSPGNDFEYVYIDNDFQNNSNKETQFETKIFSKRAKASGAPFKSLTLSSLLGSSLLLEPKDLTSESIKQLVNDIEDFGSDSLIRRSQKLKNQPTKFSNEIGRKVQGAVMLRKAVNAMRGQQEIDLYSGIEMVLRCSDGNPRRLIRIFNKLLSGATDEIKQKQKQKQKDNNAIIPLQKQTNIMRQFSISVLARVQGEPKYGSKLHKMLETVGDNMRAALHEMPLSSDTVTSIEIDTNTSDEYRYLVRSAVGLGLLYPNIHTKTPDELPEERGIYHLAYVLAPAFYLLPRRGKSRKLESMARPNAVAENVDQQLKMDL